MGIVTREAIRVQPSREAAQPEAKILIMGVPEPVENNKLESNSPKRILTVEDSADGRAMIDRALNHFHSIIPGGLKRTEVFSADAALDVLNLAPDNEVKLPAPELISPFDLVILDIGLQGEGDGGLRVLAEIQKFFPELAVIIFSAKTKYYTEGIYANRHNADLSKVKIPGDKNVLPLAHSVGEILVSPNYRILPKTA